MNCTASTAEATLVRIESSSIRKWSSGRALGCEHVADIPAASRRRAVVDLEQREAIRSRLNLAWDQQALVAELAQRLLDQRTVGPVPARAGQVEDGLLGADEIIGIVHRASLPDRARATDLAVAGAGDKGQLRGLVGQLDDPIGREANPFADGEHLLVADVGLDEDALDVGVGEREVQDRLEHEPREIGDRGLAWRRDDHVDASVRRRGGVVLADDILTRVVALEHERRAPTELADEDLVVIGRHQLAIHIDDVIEARARQAPEIGVVAVDPVVQEHRVGLEGERADRDLAEVGEADAKHGIDPHCRDSSSRSRTRRMPKVTPPITGIAASTPTPSSA